MKGLLPMYTLIMMHVWNCHSDLWSATSGIHLNGLESSEATYRMYYSYILVCNWLIFYIENYYITSKNFTIEKITTISSNNLC